MSTNNDPRMNKPTVPTPAPEAKPTKVVEMVTVINSSPFPREVDFGLVNAETGERKALRIDAAVVDKLHATKVGKAQWSREDWDAVCAHPTAKHLVEAGDLSLQGKVR
jgi:hypothetical protein